MRQWPALSHPPVSFPLGTFPHQSCIHCFQVSDNMQGNTWGRVFKSCSALPMGCFSPDGTGGLLFVLWPIPQPIPQHVPPPLASSFDPSVSQMSQPVLLGRGGGAWRGGVDVPLIKFGVGMGIFSRLVRTKQQ